MATNSLQHSEQCGQSAWPGAKSQKWYSNRKHFDEFYKDQVKLPQAVPSANDFPRGKKLVDVPKTGKEMPERLCLRVYPETKKLQMSQEQDFRFGKHMIDFEPLPRHRRPERLHLDPGRCEEEIQWRGIKTDVELKYRKSDDIALESQMQRKARLNRYYDKRNGISVAALGDKPYKATNYTADFYKHGGLIPGSSNIERKRNVARQRQIDFTIDKKAPWPVRPQRLWTDTVKEELKKENAAQLKELDDWEENTLKEHRNKGAEGTKQAGNAAAKKK